MGNPVSGVPVNIRASVTDVFGQELYSHQEQKSIIPSDRNGEAVFTFNIPSSSNGAEFFVSAHALLIRFFFFCRFFFGQTCL